MISLRHTTLADAEGVCACVGAVASERRWLASVRAFSLEETRSFLADLLRNGGVQIIAVSASTVVGWCDITPVPHEGMTHVGRLGIGLLPAYRRQGLGARLLNQTVRSAFDKGLSRIELEVFASNLAAIHLYERTGFVTEGRKRRARIIDGTEDDILVMAILREVA